MSVFQKIASAVRDDPLIRRVMSSSAHLFTNNTISLGLSVLLGPLTIRLLGATDFGLIAVVMVYASTVNSIFSFRMSELVVRYAGEYIEKGEKQKASALIKAAGLAEATVSLLAFLFVVISAGWASKTLAKTPGTALLFIVYAIGLLANFNTETSTGILQVTGKIKYQGTINLIQSMVTVLIVVAAFILKGSLTIVLVAYLAGKTILGLGLFFVAQWQLHRLLGSGWWKVPIVLLKPYRELIRFAVSSNISATIIKIFRESELLWVAYFLSTTAVGYYKVAYTLVGFLSVPADPLISATYPEINRLVIQKTWSRLRDFLRKVTTFALLYNLAIGLGFVLLGRWALGVYGGGEQYADAYPALIALLVGLAFNYTLFWNRPLLLSLGLPDFPIKVTLIVGLIKIALAFLLIPRFGYVAAGALLSFYYIASVGIMAWRGVREIKMKEER